MSKNGENFKILQEGHCINANGGSICKLPDCNDNSNCINANGGSIHKLPNRNVTNNLHATSINYSGADVIF